MKLAGKVALVTGAGRGIGKGCALELARDGAEILLNDRPGSPDLKQTCEEIRQLGCTCHLLAADVFSLAGCAGLVTAALKVVPRIDIFVSNPAFSRRGRFLDYPPELFEQTLQGTLTSGFYMSQLIARHMVEQGRGGKILFISSVQAEMPIAGSVAYGAAKAGLNHMTQTIAVELAPHGINVNAIEPGWIDTPGEHVTFSNETIAAEAAKLPLQRLGQPHEIGQAAAFLCSDAASYITGTILPVDGLFRYRHCLTRETPPVKGTN